VREGERSREKWVLYCFGEEDEREKENNKIFLTGATYVAYLYFILL
jgi:hypothetical protein